MSRFWHKADLIGAAVGRKCLIFLEAGVGIEPAFTDLQWVRRKKVSEYQAHTFLSLPIGTKLRHKIGTATQATKKDVL